MFTVDAHLDLSTNALSLNRDLTRSVVEIREHERRLGWVDTPDRGRGTVSLPALRKGSVGLVVATIISRVYHPEFSVPTLPLPGWHSPTQAYAAAQGQLTWYRVMEEQGEMISITNSAELDAHVALWNDASVPAEQKPIGYILSLEGADSVINLEHLERYYQQGLRLIGPAHFGPGRYAAGTHSDGSGLTHDGKRLLAAMEKRKIILDTTHLTDRGFYEALDVFDGPVIASHQNCRALVPGERQFSDHQLQCIIERNGVIGGALDAWMLHPHYQRGQRSPRELNITLDRLVDHFDHICQLAGSSRHVAFGSDLDGLFGNEQTPYDLDTIADLAKMEAILVRRGYAAEDVENIFHQNWLRLFRMAWSESSTAPHSM